MTFAALLNPNAAVESVKKLTGTVRMNMLDDEHEQGPVECAPVFNVRVPNGTQYRVLAVLSKDEWRKTTEVAKAVGISRENAYFSLTELCLMGYVERRLGKHSPVRGGRAPWTYRVKEST